MVLVCINLGFRKEILSLKISKYIKTEKQTMKTMESRRYEKHQVCETTSNVRNIIDFGLKQENVYRYWWVHMWVELLFLLYTTLPIYNRFCSNYVRVHKICLGCLIEFELSYSLLKLSKKGIGKLFSLWIWKNTYRLVHCPFSRHNNWK